MQPPDKRAVLDALVGKVASDLRVMRESADATRAGATHEESRPENDKDTRALEASYLARGQAARVEELQEVATQLRFVEVRAFGPDDCVAIGALVQIEVDGSSRWCFVAPVGGGIDVEVGGTRVQVITPASPVGRALLGKLQGDDFELRVGGRLREYIVERVI